jgi:hypothetical protein
MLTYSVKPRGGVVHALEVSEALARRGHEVELFALARRDEELFRPAAVPLRLVRHVPLDAPFDERIQRMMEVYADGLRPLLGGYDVVHAQDCLSANAALALRDDGVIDHVLRTVTTSTTSRRRRWSPARTARSSSPTACCASRSRGSSGWPASSGSRPASCATASTRGAIDRRAMKGRAGGSLC